MTDLTDLEILAQMINDSARITTEEHYDDFKAVLSDPQCPRSQVEIFNIPPDAVIISADKFPQPDQILKGDKGERKRADYIILAEKNNTMYAVYVELKSKKSTSAEDIQNQLRGAHCVFCYLQAVGSNFWNKRDFLGKVVHRYVGFTHIGSIRKHKTREQHPSTRHDCPENFLRFSWTGSVQFNKITGKN